MPKWQATCAGLTVEMTYAQVSARIQSTPPTMRERMADGSLVLGAWVVRRVS